MTRLASMIVPLLLVVGAASIAHAGEYYERVGNHYRPADGAWYSSTCCYKKIVKHVTVTKEVWVKVPPPKQHHHAVDDEIIETPAPRPHHRPPVVHMGEVFRQGDECFKAEPARSRGISVIVLVNVSCR